MCFGSLWLFPSGTVFGYEQDLKAIQETGVAVFPVIVGEYAGSAPFDAGVGSHDGQ